MVGTLTRKRVQESCQDRRFASLGKVTFIHHSTFLISLFRQPVVFGNLCNVTLYYANVPNTIGDTSYYLYTTKGTGSTQHSLEGTGSST